MKAYKWVLEIEVNENWVEDGFNLNNDSAKEMLGQILPFAYGHEYNAKVIKSPSKEALAKARGES